MLWKYALEEDEWLGKLKSPEADQVCGHFQPSNNVERQNIQVALSPRVMQELWERVVN